MSFLLLFGHFQTFIDNLADLFQLNEGDYRAAAFVVHKY